MNTKSKIASAMLATLLLAACGSGLNGTYAEGDSALSIRFQGNKAFVTGLSSMKTVEATYTLDGNKIKVNGPGGHPHLQLTRQKDGTLHLDFIGGTLTKVPANSGS